MRYYNAIGNNCLQCCIASILDLPLEQIVDVSKIDGYWVDSLMDWAIDQGWRVRFTYDNPVGVHISIVDWNVGGCHAVVCSDNKMIHNPNPEHKEEFTGGLYNIIITKDNNYDTILQSNGEPIITFMDSNNLPEEG